MTVGDFRFFARRQAEELGQEVTLGREPVGRDAGRAMAAGGMIARRGDPEAIVLARAADHVILDPELFHAACIAARKAADAGHIATFGIAPSEPRTGYGYIRCGASLGDGIRRVERFVEKPDAAKALRYLDEGYVWNSGNFMFRADVLVSELERHAPQIAAAVAASVERAREDLGFLRPHAES